jgi:phosphatidylserine/phosphatidylglycerophosphate/cardiolipin synthase-like enzyme
VSGIEEPRCLIVGGSSTGTVNSTPLPTLASCGMLTGSTASVGGTAVRGRGVGLDLFDAWVGDRLESILRAHHQRRLRRLGWPNMVPDGPVSDRFATRRPVRDGNAVEVLVDGEEALPAMAAAIAAARSHIHIGNWYATPDFCPVREPHARTLGEVLAEAAERVPVRVLLWAGPPVPIFQPTRRMVIAARHGFTHGTKVQCVLDARERTLHCHHEKVLVVDDTTAFVGGIDFTDLQGDRYDSGVHPPHGPLGWHDAAVRLSGPIVADVAGHSRNAGPR